MPDPWLCWSIMTDVPATLEKLCQLRGIERSFTDFRGETRSVSEDGLRRLLAAFGHAVEDESQLEREAEQLEALEWLRVLPPVVLLRPGDHVPLAMPLPLLPRIRWRVEAENGDSIVGQAEPSQLPVLEQRTAPAQDALRLALGLPALPRGYHRLTVEDDAGMPLATTTLLVPTERCFEPEALRKGHRLWGWAIQLYALRSDRNWGIGDFSDLAGYAAAAAKLGADVIGLNPLHALFPSDPEHCGPYSPSSRNFLNVLYIDPEAIPEFATSVEARRLVATPAFRQRLAQLRDSPCVDYKGVAGCKLQVLRLIHADFESQARPERRLEFRQFVKNHGQVLEMFARFHAIQEHLLATGVIGGWASWPTAYRRPDSPGVLALLAASPGSVDFHRWLQWIAAAQLEAAERSARQAGMALGIYRDLAVGVNDSGAETWAERSLYALEASIGAPPDALALQGQDWGIPPMRADVLREQAYAPFVRLLRANMGAGGALRIDHVMALMRLWWVPRGRPSAEGSYVHYRLDELLAILALESNRRRCLVIGEDLGTVPAEIRHAMDEYGIYRYRVLMFEQREDGAYRRPADFPQGALVTATTHDLPTLASFWSGSDIELRERLALYPDAGMAEAARAARARDRTALLHALEAEGLAPDGPRGADPAHRLMTPALAEAIQQYLARSRCAVMVLQPEDWLGMEDPVNVPGTHLKYPNWARKHRAEWPKYMNDESLQAFAARLGAERRRQQ
jgi:(1->4)-alpha-D-glucan 1-alpha-D-glucosylmutase